MLPFGTLLPLILLSQQYNQAGTNTPKHHGLRSVKATVKVEKKGDCCWHMVLSREVASETKADAVDLQS